MKTWTDDDRAVIREGKKSGLTNQQIADKLGTSFAAVRTQWHRMLCDTGHDEKLEAENDRLQKEITRLILNGYEKKHSFSGAVIRFGLLSDTQLGSRYENLDLLQDAYGIFRREGIRIVYHSGDLIDGEKMYRGHEYELHTHGADAQVQYCVDNYPEQEGIETYFILGNHDASFWQNAGIDIGWQIDQKRADMHYIGMDEADVTLSSDSGDIILRLYHPRKGTAYAVSYQIQKYMESLTGGRANLRILSNLSDRRTAWAECLLPAAAFARLRLMLLAPG